MALFLYNDVGMCFFYNGTRVFNEISCLPITGLHSTNHQAHHPQRRGHFHPHPRFPQDSHLPNLHHPVIRLNVYKSGILHRDQSQRILFRKINQRDGHNQYNGIEFAAPSGISTN